MQGIEIRNDEQLPKVCMKCGGAATVQRHYRIADRDDARGMVIWLRAGNDQSFRVSLCDQHENLRFIRESLGPGMLIIVAGTIVGLFVFVLNGYWQFLGYFLPLVIAALGLLHYLRKTVIEVRNIGAASVTLVGLSPQFATALQRRRREDFSSVVAQMESADK